jgi:hypothetical protein
VIVNTHGRHDPCVGIRATPIAEAMLAIVLMDHALRHRAQNADVVVATPRIAAAAPADVAAKRVRGAAVDDPDPDEATAGGVCVERSEPSVPATGARLTLNAECSTVSARRSTW